MPGILSTVPIPGEWRSTKRRKGLNALSDLHAWEYSDDDIISAARESWRSPAYAHYEVEVERRFDTSHNPPTPYEMRFRFVCRFQQPDHSPYYRGRTKTGDGTSFLLEKAKECDARRGEHVIDTSDAESLESKLPYSKATHRAILAHWSACGHRSFDSLTDRFHQMEVEYLRPGTQLPCSETLSRDVKAIHLRFAPRIKEYFQTIPGAVHLAIDGWTSPTSESYLGIVVIWYEKPKMHRCILEFIHLTSAHNGDYLAEQTALCLRRYGLEHKILAACLDNASNNSTLVEHLQQRIPHFLGTRSYVRCLAHIINLMAKAFMLPFSRPTKRAKKVIEEHAAASAASPLTRAQEEFLQAQKTDGTVDGDDLDEPSDSTEVDQGQFQHDTLVVQNMVFQAISQLSARNEVPPTANQLREAQGIMPAVAGLARRVDDSPVLQLKLHELILMYQDLKDSDRKTLSRRVATRWNSDRKALDDHIYLRQPVRWLTSEPGLKLHRYGLKESQWALADELNEALEIFEVPTRHFSCSNVPLVYQVLPAMIEMKEALESMRNATDISSVTRVGAQAALNVFYKYMATMSICEVYFIAIVMCPNIKLDWLRMHYDGESVRKIRAMVKARFELSYPPEAQTHAPSFNMVPKPKNRWLQQPSAASEDTLEPEIDSIDAYMDSDTELTKAHGGLLPYWSSKLEKTPRLARMALNYLTAPATSIDAERAFSAGRLTVNHLQHNMSSDTFEAKMAVGSWYGTPFLSEVSQVASILQEVM